MGDFEKVEYFVRRAEDPISSQFVVRRAAPGEESKEAEQKILAYSPEEAIAISQRPRVREDFPQMFTAEEMMVAIKAVATAEGGGANDTIMAHVRGKEDVSPETADAIRKIVIRAYYEMKVGE